MVRFASIWQLIYLAFKNDYNTGKNKYINEALDLLLLNNAINNIINAKINKTTPQLRLDCPPLIPKSSLLNEQGLLELLHK